MPGSGYTKAKTTELRYGENAYQKARMVSLVRDDPLSIPLWKKVAGEAPSATNLTDLDRALTTLSFAYTALRLNSPRKPYTVALAVKHGNCCGAAYSTSPLLAIRQMIEGDLLAIFGGIVLLNCPVDEHVAGVLLNWKSMGRRILDVVAAPSISPRAIELLNRNGGRCKMFVNPEAAEPFITVDKRFRQVRGGIIEQDPYSFVLNMRSRKVKRVGPARPDLKLDLAFAAALCATTNSNTITLVQKGMLVGQGVAQTRRDTAAWLAVEIARRNSHDLQDGDTVACSDSFFPFPDGPKILIDAGVEAIFSTTGSVRDKDVQDVCRNAGVTLYQLPDKEARMFFGH